MIRELDTRNREPGIVLYLRGKGIKMLVSIIINLIINLISWYYYSCSS